MPYQAQYLADESAGEFADAAELTEFPFTGYGNKSLPDTPLTQDPAELAEIIAYFSSLNIDDIDVYILPFTTAGSRQISVLPDLMVIEYSPEIVELINSLGDNFEADKEYVTAETSIGGAFVYRRYVVDGVEEFRQVATLKSKPDDLAAAFGDELIPGIGSNVVVFWDATVDFEAPSSRNYTDFLGRPHTEQAGAYYLVVHANPIMNALSPTVYDGMTLDAGRYLVTTGNPTGQRAATWGEQWVNTLYNATPPPPLIPPELDVPGAPLSLQQADQAAADELADAKADATAKAAELQKALSDLEFNKGRLEGLLEEQKWGAAIQVAKTLALAGQYAKVYLEAVSPVGQAVAGLDGVRKAFSVAGGFQAAQQTMLAAWNDPNLKTTTDAYFALTAVVKNFAPQMGLLGAWFNAVAVAKSTQAFANDSQAWWADNASLRTEIENVTQRIQNLQQKAEQLRTEITRSTQGVTLKADPAGVILQGESADAVLMMQSQGVRSLGTLQSPTDDGPAHAAAADPKGQLIILMAPGQRVEVHSGSAIIEGAMSSGDRVVFDGAYASYQVTRGVDFAVVRGAGVEVIIEDVGLAQFSDFAFAAEVSGSAAAQVFNAQRNLLRTPPDLDTVWADAATAQLMGLDSYATTLIQQADASTAVAILSYQFFTGRTPSSGGLDYLVSPTGGNANHLNSAYYQFFNLENRYINFAVNLGKNGEGAARFEAGYGALTLAQAMTKAYVEIFGAPPAAGQVDGLLNGQVGPNLTRAQYFAAYGGDGVTGIGTKAAMVGWLLAEAVKADLGMYARSNNAYLADLADGAGYLLDLVATYGRAGYAFPDAADTSAPQLASSTPADNATGVAVGANLTLTFSEAVKAGAGAIEIRRASDGGLAASLSVANTAQVSFSGSTATLNPPADLAAGTAYYLILASGVILDLAGNPYGGIASATALNFTTASAAPVDTTAPTLSSSLPADNATGVAIGANLTLTFSEAVKAGSGAIEIRRSSDGSLAASLSVANTAQVAIAGSVVTLNPPSDLAAGAGYYLVLASGVILDLAGNPYGGIASATALNFTTAAAAPVDTTAPTLSSSLPADNATGVAVGANLSLTFNEAVQAGGGLIEIRRVSDGVAVFSVQPNSGAVSFSGSTVTLNPPSDLAAGVAYYVTLAAGAITDLAGNAYAGISAATTLNFTTLAAADTTAPLLVSSTPADNATSFSPTSDLTLTFNEAVKGGDTSVLISIRLVSNGLAVYSFNVANTERVTFSGSTVILKPHLDLDPGTAYYLTIPAGVITDLAGNAYAGISTATTLNFTTTAPGDGTPPTLVSSTPADNAGAVLPDANLTLTFSEAVKAGVGAIEVHRSDGSLFTSLAVTDNALVSFSGSTVTLNPSVNLPANGAYYLTLAPGVITDLAGTAYAGIGSSTALNFFTVGDDYADFHNDTASPMPAVNVGGSIGAQINYLGDWDVFTVNLTAGQTYTLKAVGTTINGAPPVDTYLILYSSAGTFQGTSAELGSNDDSGGSNNARIVHTATYTGVHYLQVTGWDTNHYVTGGYYVSAQLGNVAAPWEDDGAATPLVGLVEQDPLAL